MRKTILFLPLMLLFAFAAKAQEQTDSEKNEIIYEVDVKSHINGAMLEIVHYKGSSFYYRINKETGEVWILNGEKAYTIELEDSKNNTVYPGKTNFQLIVGQYNVYLMNINTGETWCLKMTKPFKYSSHRFVVVKHN